MSCLPVIITVNQTVQQFNVTVDNTNDPIQIQVRKGVDGYSAYQIAVLNGFVGTEQDWLDSLVGQSAYELAVEEGFIGTEAEWLEFLQGAEGDSAYQVAVNNGFVGTEQQWLDSLVGPTGEDGREIELQKSATHVQWRYVGDVSWIDLIPLSDLKGDTGSQGATGETGASIELQKSATHIQWRVVGDVNWINLVALADLKGDKGDTGNTGATGSTGADGDSAYQVALDNGFVGTEPQWLASLVGADGREIELQKTATYVQWRYVGDVSWINLVLLADITGPAGDDGREIELQKSATHIQWRYVGDVSWINLVPLTDLKGDKGDKGDTGATGATGTFDTETQINSLKFDPTPNTATPLVLGEMRYSEQDLTMEVKVTNDVTLQINQEQNFPVINKTAGTLLNGRAIRITGHDEVSETESIDYSSNDSGLAAFVDGILTQDLAPNAKGLATSRGKVRDINTSAGVEGGLIFLGVNGALIATEPTHPAKIVVIGKYGHISTTVGELLVGVASAQQTVINNITNELTLKALGNPGICQRQPILVEDIIIDTTLLKLTVATVKGGTTITPANPIRFFTDGAGLLTQHEKTVAVDFNFTNTTGIWYFYFNGSGSPIATQVAWVGEDFKVIAPVYRFYWNATLSGEARLVVEGWECHLNDISASSHAWMHALGSIWESGLNIFSNALTTGAPNADGRNTCIALSGGRCSDDGLEWPVVNTYPATPTLYFNQNTGAESNPLLTALTSGLFPIRSNDAGGLLTIRPATRFPFLWNTGNNRPQYLTLTGVATDVPDDNYFVYYMYNLSDRKVGNTIKIVSGETAFASMTDVRAHSWETLRGLYPTLRDNEIRPLYKLIFFVNHSNPQPYDVGCKYTVLREYLDIRKLTTSAGGQLSGSIPASSVTEVTDGNVQNALDIIRAKMELSIAYSIALG